GRAGPGQAGGDLQGDPAAYPRWRAQGLSGVLAGGGGEPEVRPGLPDRRPLLPPLRERLAGQIGRRKEHPMAADGPAMPGRGERHEGTLTSDLPVLQGWTWPYVTIAGRQDGPQATIIAGIHGCEYVSIRAAVRLARELDPAEVRGRILVVPIV